MERKQKMRLTKKQLEEIIEFIFEAADKDIEVNGPQDFDVVLTIPKDAEDHVWAGVQQILEDDQADMQELFDIQTSFQKKVKETHGYEAMSLIEHVRLMFIGIITEACEFLEETNWKPWKKPRDVNVEKLRGEAIDLWHFVINLTIASGMDAKEVIERFKSKNKINKKRQEDRY